MQKMKILIFVPINIIILGILCISNAQVISGNVRFSSQAEINSFSGTSINGNLIIDGSDITDLTPLLIVTSVGGTLAIVNNNSSLTTLDGLNNITHVGDALIIGGNPLITTLDGLNNISSIDGDLFIDYNSSLITLDGLNNISSVVGYLYIGYNSSLANLDGLNNISSVGEYISIDNNSSLTNLDGLKKIDSIIGLLRVSSNPYLANLDGLSNIAYVGGDLTIINNDSLSNFCGLYLLLSSDGLGGSYDLQNNSLNPTKQQIINNEDCLPSDVVENDIIPNIFQLKQNYPNPFNPMTIISYSLPQSSFVRLSVFDMLGQEIKVLVNEIQQGGNYNIEFFAHNLPSGSYFYRLENNNFNEVKKLLLLK